MDTMFDRGVVILKRSAKHRSEKKFAVVYFAVVVVVVVGGGGGGGGGGGVEQSHPGTESPKPLSPNDRFTDIAVNATH